MRSYRLVFEPLATWGIAVVAMLFGAWLLIQAIGVTPFHLSERHELFIGVSAAGILSVMALILLLTKDRGPEPSGPDMRRVEAALRESEERYRLLMEGLKDFAIFMLDADGRVASWNASAERLTGYHAEEIKGRHFSCFYQREDVARGEPEKHWKTATTQGRFACEDWRARKNGQRFWAELLITAVKNAEGHANGFAVVMRDISDRQQAEGERAQFMQDQASRAERAEAKFQGLLEAAPDALVVVDSRRRIVLVNGQTEEMFGYDRKKLLGEQIETLFPQRAHQRYIERLASHLSKSGAVLSETRLELTGRRENGTEFPVEISLGFLETHEGTLVTSAIRDITERRRAEEGLLELASIVETSNDAIISMTLEGTIVTWNPAAERLYGYTAQEVTGQPVQILVPLDRTDAVMAIVHKIKRGESLYHYETRQVRSDGTEIDVSLTFSPIRDGAGKIRTLSMIARDISERKRTDAEIRKLNQDLERRVAARTAELSQANAVLEEEIAERKRAEEALLASEERYRELFENANDLVYTHDIHGNFVSINKAGEQISGYQRDEILKMNIVDVVAPEYMDLACRQVDRKLCESAARTTYELEILAKEGRRVPLEVSTRLIYRAGKPVGVQGIARDVTDRRQLEDQLRQAQKMEAVGRLAGGVAHDFNNLLTAILGYSEILLNRPASTDGMRDGLEEIKKAGERAAGLTRQLLAFSRKQVLAPTVLNLNSVVTNVDKMLRRLIGEHIELATALESKLRAVKADPGQVEQVLMNLAVNSRDAMPDGGKLTIETRNVDLEESYTRARPEVRPGPYALLTVTDTGCGIDDETRLHIFEPFFTTKEKGKGTGLGLATVYGIIKQSGGHIEVDSQPGKGTTFRVYLPVVEEKAPSWRPQPKNGAPAPRGTETVLLVEDEDSVRALARHALQLNGYTVIEASHGAQALTLCEKHDGPLHILVSDVVMPQMSGRELAERLVPLRPGLKVLYVSGYTDSSLLRQGSLNRETAFLQKPFTPDGLARKVREVLDQSKLELVG